MGSVLDTIVVKFGESNETAVTIPAKVDFDDQLNGVDKNGNPKRSFTQNDSEIYVIAQFPGYIYDKVKYTSGQVDYLGLVTRTITEEEVFFPDTDGVYISWEPRTNAISGSFYGNSSSLGFQDDKAIASIPPVIADISYSVSVHSFRIKKPSNATITKDKSWPLGVVIWVNK